MQDSERKGGGGSGPREPRARVALPSKSVLLASADKLNYAGRISLAGRIGADHKGTAELGQLLAQLREVLLIESAWLQRSDTSSHCCSLAWV